MPTDRDTAKSSGWFFNHPLYFCLLLLAIAGTTIGASYRAINLPLTNQDYAELEAAIQYLESVRYVDSVRQNNIQRVIKIMTHYNRNMPEFEKYDIASAIYQASVKYSNLDIDLICATITQETGSTWEPRVVSPAGAMGLMQVMPATARFVAKYERIKWTSEEEVLFNPVSNIRIGCRYLSSLMELFNDCEGALAAYNGGEYRASLWLRQDKADGILWQETQNYVPSVLKLTEELRSINH
jgi:soluble lytic murein transglycosylase